MIKKPLPSIGQALISALSTLQLPSQLKILRLMALAMHRATLAEVHKLCKRITVLLRSEQRFQTVILNIDEERCFHLQML